VRPLTPAHRAHKAGHTSGLSRTRRPGWKTGSVFLTRTSFLSLPVWIGFSFPAQKNPVILNSLRVFWLCTTLAEHPKARSHRNDEGTVAWLFVRWYCCVPNPIHAATMPSALRAFLILHSSTLKR